MTDAASALVTLAIPCRTDEPALERALAGALASWRAAPQARRDRLEVLVCLNGAPRSGPSATARAFAAANGARLVEIDLDAAPAALPPADGALTVVVLHLRRAGKPIAWNVLRQRARGPLAIFMDADVDFAPDAFGLLLTALEAHPEAALASGKTTCAARPGMFEAVMAVPYGVDFPNLSPQLYAARIAALPPAMPDDLIEPERWLELVLGTERVVRVPAARVAVRLPDSLADFFRQRIRIEMGKVQLSREYPALTARSAPQPGVRTALASLGPVAVVRLATYLALRSVAHVAAWWRYRRGDTATIWRQAASTKHWDAA
jgi:cellulose synthase/poly-beta-1,6-N-acetylglucosamine synthase-like glycosyltransferase